MAQERKPVMGKVTADSDDLDGIYVINKTAETSITTSKGGYFTIAARPKDTLIFSAVQFVAKQLVVEQADMAKELLLVKLEVMVRTMDEVIIEKSNITAEALGIVPKGQKIYTPAERKIYTATEGTDAIFNAISGRTKMLKTNAEFEKKEMLMDKIDYIYSNEDIVKEFKIPEEYVRGFIFYVVEDKEFAAAIKAKNHTMARFLMSGLSVQYLSLINEK